MILRRSDAPNDWIRMIKPPYVMLLLSLMLNTVSFAYKDKIKWT